MRRHNNTKFDFLYIYPNSPPLPDTLPVNLKDLILKLLEKDQKKRITIPQIRDHPWILNSSRRVPSKEENCNVEISVSEEDMEQAFKTYQTPIHILVNYDLEVHIRLHDCGFWYMHMRFLVPLLAQKSK